MEIENTFIEGLKIIHLKYLEDRRGTFRKVFNYNFFKDNGLETDFKESYYSISAKNVIRGMHFQTPPAEHTKLVYVNKGAILDVILDIRKNSPTYGKHFKIEINNNNPFAIYIPVGCAHGFLSLENNTMVTYLQTSVYNPKCDSGIKYNSFEMNWKIEQPIISERDNSFISFTNFKSPF